MHRLGILIICVFAAILSATRDQDFSEVRMKVTRDTVQKALNQDKTLGQKAGKNSGRWNKYSGDFVNEDAFIETLYNSLTGQDTGTFIKHNR